MGRVPILNVNEIFGPTIQGEGPEMGRRATFLRLAGCNLACSWCDTPYSWDWKRYSKSDETHPMREEDVAIEVGATATGTLVITGGEPMLQQHGIAHLATLLPRWRLTVETNGTRPIRPETAEAIHRFVVSPKLVNSGDPEKRRLVWPALVGYAGLGADFKFVLTDVAELDEVRDIVTFLKVPRSRVWVMPEGATRERHMDNLAAFADDVIGKYGYNLTPRLHILAWSDRRGV